MAAKGRSLWRDLNTSFLDGWATPASHLFADVSRAQKAQADSADEYVDLVLRAWGEHIPPAGEIVPGSLTGIASDGRGLASLLMQPVVSTKFALKNGVPLDRAMARGQAHLDAILRTQVTDAGRVADNLAVTTRVDTKWVRVLYGETCDRCAVLAGNVYSWKADFLRHPRCDCYAVPITSRDDAKAAGVIVTAKDYFDSLSKAEQDSVFTKDSAQAVRDGADIAQVVNARRSMSAAGKTTKEGTRHGFAKSRGVTSGRLMPEAIYELADGNQAEAIRLLRLNAYIA